MGCCYANTHNIIEKEEIFEQISTDALNTQPNENDSYFTDLNLNSSDDDSTHRVLKKRLHTVTLPSPRHDIEFSMSSFSAKVYENAFLTNSR